MVVFCWPETGLVLLIVLQTNGSCTTLYSVHGVSVCVSCTSHVQVITRLGGVVRGGGTIHDFKLVSG